MSELICSCAHELDDHRRIEAKEASAPQPCRKCDCTDIRYRTVGHPQ